MSQTKDVEGLLDVDNALCSLPDSEYSIFKIFSLTLSASIMLCVLWGKLDTALQVFLTLHSTSERSYLSPSFSGGKAF